FRSPPRSRGGPVKRDEFTYKQTRQLRSQFALLSGEDMTVDIITTEEQEQRALVQWLELHKIRYTHVPNEGKHKVQYRAKQKRLGVKPGVPDILIFDRPPLYPENVGVAIELKRQKGGRVTPEQTAWLEHLKAR